MAVSFPTTAQRDRYGRYPGVFKMAKVSSRQIIPSREAA